MRVTMVLLASLLLGSCWLSAVDAGVGVAAQASSGCNARGCNQGDPYDHPPDETENPPRAVAKRGPPFWCTVARDDAEVGVCSPTEAGCRDYRASLHGQGVDTRSCVKVGAAVCFSAVRVADATRIERCFPSAGGCHDQRAIKVGKSEYTKVSECADVPSR
jgi:hypothetical protein